MEAILNLEQEELLKRTRDVLGQLRDVLADTAADSADRTALAESIRQLDELFLLVIAGEFNSGKSTFINALVGQPLLDEGVTPTTSQIYLLQYGDKTEQRLAEKGIWRQTAPVELLRQLTIVDTPGTNAILREHEALTAEFIPRSDLVLFITSADRPFTESERSFLSQIRDWGKKIVMVVNKVDILADTGEVDQVVDFVIKATQDLIGEKPVVFAVSARQAKKAKAGQPQLWTPSGFEPLEQYIQETLDDDGRFRLKLLNPLGVGHKLAKRQLDATQQDLNSLKVDQTLLEDIQRQTTYYNDDMQRNFKARLGEIDNLLYAMEKRGDEFFDEMIRFGRIPDLIRAKQVEKSFEEQVVADTPQQIEARVNELIDWLVEQDLRQWTAVADHLSQRKEDVQRRMVGQGGPREGTLAYDRQRLIDSIGKSTRRAVESYDKEKEAAHIGEIARMAVVNTGLAGVGVGIGTALALATTVAWVDITGVVAGLTSAAFGLIILPHRRRKAKVELSEKLAELRDSLVSELTGQFEREMRRSAQRVEDTVAPFARFVRAENDRLTEQYDALNELEAHLNGLRAQLRSEKVTG
jgi:small GTP-binding protein